MSHFPLKFPILYPGAPEPIWDEGFFSIGEKKVSVLEYGSNMSGWNDDLTSFHEEHAGKNHFIDCASRQHTITELKKHLKVINPTIMEIGCSSGHLLEKLHKERPEATLIGADIVYSPLVKLAEKLPGIPMLRFDLLDCPLPDNYVNAVILLNVLEHIEDDLAALKQIHRILKPGGMVIIEVPAGPHLYDIYDKELLHFRRYLLKDLINKVQQLDFDVVTKSHLGFFIYPGFWFIKKRNQGLLTLPQEKQKERVTKNIRDTGSSKILHGFMKMELALGHWINYPKGIRCLVSCIKK